MPEDDFGRRYALALRRYLSEGGEAILAEGHELGRRALREQVSMLEIVEHHFRLVEETTDASHTNALQFLLQTLATFDVATQGFLDGTKRYEQQRARADDLADRDAFRTALVNSLQEGFFVVDHDGTVTEINEAFAAITGFDSSGLPYRWPHPWLLDEKDAGDRLSGLVESGTVQSETPIQHRDGRKLWVLVSINSVTEEGDDRGAYVGTLRDVTTERAAEARRNAVARLATAVGVATSVKEVLHILLDILASPIDVKRVVIGMWTHSESDPAVMVDGSPDASSWQDLDSWLRQSFLDARGWQPLSVVAVGAPDGSGRSVGMMTVLSGDDDTVLWLEYPAARMTSEQDQSLVAALIGHLSLAIQHVRQFETAREASLTLQRAMLPTTNPPVGFAVRYEPAVSPLEIGGDWYDVLAVGDHQIGIIVGDCVGSGLSAAAVMGQLRSSARVLLINGAAPARLLEELDSAAALIPGAYCTTTFVGTIDTTTGELVYSSAGHVPALLAVPGAEPEVLTSAVTVPLAVRRTGPRPQASQWLSPSSTLMLYTDGLIERREKLIDEEIDRAGRVLAEMIECPADEVADAMLTRMAPAKGFDDDVAIVVYRRPPAPLRIDVPGTPDRLSDIRAELASWLRSTGIPSDMAGDIVLVVNEACTNSMEHAYRDVEAGRVLVDVEAKGRQICISITDFGSWKSPDPNPRLRGRGVPLMRAVTDDVTIDGTSTGTTVVMDIKLA